MCSPSNPCKRRAGPSPHPSADDDRTPNAASSLICFLGEEVPYRQGEPADITAPDGYASTWVGTGCVSDNANTYFIGHNPGVFERVMDLEIGDKITVFDDDGASRTYYVFDTLFLPNGSNYFVYEGRIAPTGETITLQTCTRRQPAGALRHGPLGATGANVARSALLS